MSYNGHIGDLPVLIVNKKGMATLPLLAARLTTKKIKGRSLMDHKNGDDDSAQPKN